jgi:hypothetical protein
MEGIMTTRTVSPAAVTGLFLLAMLLSVLALAYAPRGDVEGFVPGHGDILPQGYMLLVPCWLASGVATWALIRTEKWPQRVIWLGVVMFGLFLQFFVWVMGSAW